MSKEYRAKNKRKAQVDASKDAWTGDKKMEQKRKFLTMQEVSPEQISKILYGQ